MTAETDTMITLPILGEFTYHEIHAFEDGLYCGYEEEKNHDYTQEEHYWRMGYLVGDIILSKFK